MAVVKIRIKQEFRFGLGGRLYKRGQIIEGELSTLPPLLRLAIENKNFALLDILEQ
jgi:hypothetical protein